MHKLKLSDNSFYIVDDNFEITLFKPLFKKKKITIKDYLATNKYRDYYLRDLINGQKITRAFQILPVATDEEDLPHNIRLKYAEDIEVNDLVLGANHEPERVIELHTGEEQMYDIEVNGKTYTVNEGHVLELIDKDTGEHLQMQVGVYFKMYDEFKTHYVMEVASLE